MYFLRLCTSIHVLILRSYRQRVQCVLTDVEETSVDLWSSPVDCIHENTSNYNCDCRSFIIGIFTLNWEHILSNLCQYIYNFIL